jgi:hypothetical protein
MRRSCLDVDESEEGWPSRCLGVMMMSVERVLEMPLGRMCTLVFVFRGDAGVVYVFGLLHGLLRRTTGVVCR